MDYSSIFAIFLLVMIIICILYYLFYDKLRHFSNFSNFSNLLEKPTLKVKQKRKVDDFKTKIDYLSKLIYEPEREYEREHERKYTRELYEMYYKGIPDTYDQNGNIIHGIEPDAQKAIFYLEHLINSDYGTPEDSLCLARIYHYGMHKFDRDLDQAEKIYTQIKFSNVDFETLEKIKEALADIQKIRVYAWLNLPLERPIIPTPAVQAVLNLPTMRVRVPTVPVPVPVQNATIDQKQYDDPQNTHNPQVLSTIRFSLDKLKNTHITRDQGTSALEIKNYIEKLDESDKKQDALKSLHAIERNTDKLSSTNMTEMEALTLVWNRINDSARFNEEISKNLKETLFDELASMQEFGTTICSTGRFTHIIDTLNGVDEEVSIKPSYAINEEMLTKSAKIRQDLLESVPEQEREQLIRGTSPNQTEFDSNLKKTIVAKLKEEYVDTGILPEKKFYSEIGKWINEI